MLTNTKVRSLGRSSAVPLALAWVALTLYASLFPFSGWRWLPGVALWDLLRLPWPRYFIAFDISSNLLGYLPLGFLVALARLRHGAGRWPAFYSGVLVGALLSYATELVQQLLPQRVPSLLDWLLNAAGALIGAWLAVLLAWLGLLRRWQSMRERWLGRGSGGALALLLLWPVALLFPPPVTLGLGQVGPPLFDLLDGLLAGVPWAEGLADWLASGGATEHAFSAFSEGLAVALGLLSPCLLAFAASPPGWRRVWLVLGAAVLGLGVTTLSTALNFGPDHALAWRTPHGLMALLAGLALALALLWIGRRLAAALALVALTGLVMLVHQAPTDPYYAQSLQAWAQGRFIRFHGLAQWMGWLWPFLAMGWLLGRLGMAQDKR